MEIPSGLQLMFRAMNIDPQKIMADFKAGLERFEAMWQLKSAQLDRVESQNAEILAILKAKDQSNGQADDAAAGSSGDIHER